MKYPLISSILLLSLGVSSCDSSPADNNSLNTLPQVSKINLIQDNIIHLGAIVSSSSQSGELQYAMVNNPNIAITAINQHLSSKGYPYQVQIHVQSIPDNSPEEAFQIIENNFSDTHLIAGPPTSSQMAFIANQIHTKQDKLIVSQFSSANHVNLASQNLFSFAPADSKQAKMLAGVLHQKDINCIAYLTRDSIWGLNLFERISAEFQHLNHRVPYAKNYLITYDAGDEYENSLSDFTPQLQDLKNRVLALSENPICTSKVAIQVNSYGEIVQILSDALQINQADSKHILSSIKWIGSSGLSRLPNLSIDNPIALSAAQFATSNTVQLEIAMPGIAPNYLSNFEAFTQTIAPATLQTGVQPNYYDAAFWDALFVLAETAATLGPNTISISELRQAFINTANQYLGASGKTNLDPITQNRTEAFYDLWSIQYESGPSPKVTYVKTQSSLQ